jgi:hypothetical protein
MVVGCPSPAAQPGQLGGDAGPGVRDPEEPAPSRLAACLEIRCGVSLRRCSPCSGDRVRGEATSQPRNRRRRTADGNLGATRKTLSKLVVRVFKNKSIGLRERRRVKPFSEEPRLGT